MRIGAPRPGEIGHPVGVLRRRGAFSRPVRVGDHVTPRGARRWPDSVPISPDNPDFDWIRAFAEGLVEQVRPWLPANLRIYVEEEPTLSVKVTDEDDVWFSYDIPEMLTNDWRPHLQPRMERVEVTLEMFLHHLQRYLVRQTRRPWPGDSETQLPAVKVEILGTVAQGWFEPVQGEGPVLYFDIPPEPGH